MAQSDYQRCRLVLVATPRIEPDRLAAALGGGDVASVILAVDSTGPEALQRAGMGLAPVAQRHDAAFLVENDTRIMGRCGADGLHVTGKPADVAEAIASLRPKKVIGAGDLRTRHDAMTAGESNPDYVFFGRLDGDTGEAPFDRALDLATWWAPTFVIPAIVMAGSVPASVAEVAATGAEFAALSRAVFNTPDPAAAVAEANRILSAAAQSA